MPGLDFSENTCKNGKNFFLMDLLLHPFEVGFFHLSYIDYCYVFYNRKTLDSSNTTHSVYKTFVRLFRKISYIQVHIYTGTTLKEDKFSE